MVVERESIGKFSDAINSTSVSFLFFPGKKRSASTQFALSGLSFRVAGQKGIAVSKDYYATVTNCPVRT
jgi:hypothetical protein